MYSVINGSFIIEDLFYFSPHYFSNKKYVHINVGPTLAHPVLKSLSHN